LTDVVDVKLTLCVISVVSEFVSTGLVSLKVVMTTLCNIMTEKDSTFLIFVVGYYTANTTIEQTMQTTNIETTTMDMSTESVVTTTLIETTTEKNVESFSRHDITDTILCICIVIQ
jgi:hypothetical protein